MPTVHHHTTAPGPPPGILATAPLQQIVILMAQHHDMQATPSTPLQGLAALANHLRCSGDRWWRGSKLLIIELSNTCKLTPPDPSQPQQACTPYPLHTGASSRSSNPLPQLTAPHAPVLPTPRSPFSPAALQQLALALGTAGLALTTLRLDHTPIADAGAAALCEGLQRCSGLKELSMAYCSMGPQGVRHVATALLRRFKPDAAEEEAPAEPAPARPAPAAVAKPAGGGPGSRPSSGRPSRLSMTQPAVPPAEPHTELAPLAEEEGQAEQDGAAAGAAAEPGAAGAAAEPAAAESSVDSGAAASAAGLPNALGGLAAVAMAAAAAARAQRVVKPGELLRLCLSGNMCGAACLHHVAALLRGAPCLQVLQLADFGLQEHDYWALQVSASGGGCVPECRAAGLGQPAASLVQAACCIPGASCLLHPWCKLPAAPQGTTLVERWMRVSSCGHALSVKPLLPAQQMDSLLVMAADHCLPACAQNLAAAVAGSGLQQLDLDMNFIGKPGTWRCVAALDMGSSWEQPSSPLLQQACCSMSNTFIAYAKMCMCPVPPGVLQASQRRPASICAHCCLVLGQVQLKTSRAVLPCFCAGDRCASLLLPALQQCSSLVLLKVSSRLGRQAMAALLAAMEANAAAGRKKGGKKGGGKNKK